MPDEITIIDKVSALKNSILWEFNPGVVQIDWTTIRWYDRVHTIGTTEESIASFGDVVAPTMIILQNLSTANFVDWGVATGVYRFQLPAGPYPSTRVIWKSGLTLYLKADTADCDVRVVALET